MGDKLQFAKIYLLREHSKLELDQTMKLLIQFHVLEKVAGASSGLYSTAV